jgi:tricorn protease
MTFRVLRALALTATLTTQPSALAFAAIKQSAPAAPSQAAGVRQAATEPQPAFAEPSISPDREEIAFVSGGDIWTVPAAGGEARLLVSHPADERRPLYSPDGRRLAFVSTRTGNGDIYVLTFATGDLKRITFDDYNDQLDGWSRDGRMLYFSSTSRDISGGMNDLYRVSSEGGTPMQVSADRYTNEFFAQAAPDDSSVAFTARGVASGQWWRLGSSHLDESEIWVLRDVNSAAAPASYEQLTRRGARELWPMWGADSRTLFYVSDRNGAQNIWRRGPDGAARAVTNFTAGRVLWPTISYDGKTIVFERDFRVWRLDTSTSRAAEVRITRRGSPAGPGVEHLRQQDQIQDFALSPDGKKVAYVMRGEVFAASSADGGDGQRLTSTPADEWGVNWSPDSRRLVYVSDRDGVPRLYLFDFATNVETRLTNSEQSDAAPRFSPDGKMIGFQRARRELRVLDVETKQERVVASGWFDQPPIISERPFTWSPDSRWIAFAPTGARLFRNVHLARADAAGQQTGQPVSFLANANSNTVSWSPDGTYLLFETGQRTEAGQLARVDLIPRTPRFREDQFRDLFREQPPPGSPTRREPPQPSASPSPAASPSPTIQPSPAASPTPDGAGARADERKGKPVEVVFEGMRRRLSLLPVGVDVNYNAISPDGKWVVVIAFAAGQENLYIYPLDELAPGPAVARQLTSTPGNKALAQFSPDSKEIFYVENGRLQIVNLEGRARPLAVVGEMDVDFGREKMEVFRQAWGWLRDHFYDPGYHGANWQEVRARYEPYVAGARTPDEMRRVLNLMVGELNASHLGVQAPPNAGAQPHTGRLGLRFDRVEYERSGKLRVTKIVPLGPAALAREIRAGDYLLAVDGREIDARTNLDELLAYKINRRVSLTVAQSADGAGRREAAVRPVSGQTEKALLYREWVEENREYVARASSGRLGYVHMFDMSANSLSQLYVDLDAENHGREGIVIDLRNNNGGFVNAYAIDVFARRGYLTMTMRDLPPAPARAVLGQRAPELPSVLVINQHSLSDAEDFTEGYRTLKLGRVVGEPTAGWIIYTWNQQLLDGSVVRLPRTKITDNAGRNMELNPRPVDVTVTRPVGETLSDRDTQLDAAVRELLGQLGRPRPEAGR